MTDTEKLEQVIALFEKSGLYSMDLELGGLKVRLKKSAGTKTVPIKETPQTSLNTPKQENAKEQVKKDENIAIVASPLVGVFYASRQEKGEPLVHKGDTVKKGDVLCLIEAMKTMNELVSPYDGVIERILVQDGSMAEFDQPLFEIRKE